MYSFPFISAFYHLLKRIPGKTDPVFARCHSQLGQQERRFRDRIHIINNNTLSLLPKNEIFGHEIT